MDNTEMEWDFSNIEYILNQLGEDVVKIQKTTTKKMAEKVKKAVEKELPRSNIKASNYTHMQDDVKVTSLKEDEDGDMIREIKGGSKTGYKWKWLEFGVDARNISANPFMTRALKNTEKECHDIVNEEIGKIVKQIGGA